MPSNPVKQFRALGTRGILRDPSPYDLDDSAWSAGSNVRFANTKAMRSPVFRVIYDPLPFAPTFVVGSPSSSGYDHIVYAGSTGRLWSYFSGALAEVTPSGIHRINITAGGSGYTSAPTVTLSAPGGGGVTATAIAALTGTAVTAITVVLPGTLYASAPTVTISGGGGSGATATATLEFATSAITGQFTSAFLGDVLYVNNPTKGLYYQSQAGNPFHKDPQWDPTWSAAVFRVYKDFPIALNVTKGAQANPTLVKWGDTTLAGQTTSSWDSNDPTKNTGETPIADLTGPILDGEVLKDIFVIYSHEQIWAMAPSNDTFIFQFSRLFSEGGIIGTNCVAEVDGYHYVFGPTDIYRHDGTTKTSLVDKRNHEFVYRNLNKKQSDRCFVLHMQSTHDILFAYVSSDPDAAFPKPATGCNRGIVYNYVDDTMAPVDLPNVTMMTMANVNSVMTYASSAPITYDTTGGSYADQEDGFGRTPVAVSGVMSGLFGADRLVCYDFLDKGAVAFPYLPELNATPFLERTGIDLDAEGAGLDSYKLVNRIFPQVSIFRDVPVAIQVGSAMTPSGPVKWSPVNLFNPVTDYKIDVRQGGRYVGFRMSVPGNAADFEVTGFDAEILNNGSR